MPGEFDLTERLTKDLRPVRPVSLKRELVKWFVLAAVTGAGLLTWVGARPDLAVKLVAWPYLLALGLFTVAFFAASYAALRASVPGRAAVSFKEASWITAGVAIALASYAGLLGTIGPAPTAVEDPVEALACCLRITFGAAFPNVLLMAMMSRLGPIVWKGPMAIAVAASTLSVSIVSQLNCPYDDKFHVLVGHGLMVLVAAVASFFVYLMIARWASRTIYRLHRTRVTSTL